jgi:predicted nuclease of predicted toxin-antitoxin system
MRLRFIADENVPFQVMEELRKAGYDVLAVRDVAHTGLRNNELAEISIKLERIIMTRDADFTRLTKPLLSRIKVMYLKVTGDPQKIAELILDNIKNCAPMFRTHNVIMLDDEGCHPL